MPTYEGRLRAVRADSTLGFARSWLPGPFRLAVRGLLFALGADAGEEVGSRFVGAVFAAGEFGLGRHQLPAERLGKYRLGERVHPLPCRAQLRLDPVGQLE